MQRNSVTNHAPQAKNWRNIITDRRIWTELTARSVGQREENHGQRYDDFRRACFDRAIP